MFFPLNNLLKYLTTWLFTTEFFSGGNLLTPQQKLANDSWACSFDKRVPLKSCQLQGSWSLVVLNLKLYIVATPYPPRRMLLRLFQHTFGTHPFSQPLPMSFFQGFLSQLVKHGELQKNGCVRYRECWLLGFSLPGIPASSGKATQVEGCGRKLGCRFLGSSIFPFTKKNITAWNPKANHL